MKIAINGFGRIGRIFFRQAFGYPNFEIVAINDLSDPQNLAYLLKYDTVYGPYEKSVEVKDNKLIVDGKEILIFKETDPTKLPWKDLDIDVVVEATEFITSNASCTTNSVNPVLAILMKRIGIKKAILTTIHAYTATQNLVDGIVKGYDFRRGRAAGLNIVPSTTGAAEATVRVIPYLKGKFDGISIRVPVICGSLSDITVLTERPTTVEEINNIFKEEAQKPEWQGILKVVEEEIVSSDILKEPYGAIVDLTLTRVVDGDLVKVFSWYDNEWGYCAMLIKHIEKLFS
jgi:glyceraldehyde 3-phosphate dehydrogenase